MPSGTPSVKADESNRGKRPLKDLKKKSFYHVWIFFFITIMRKDYFQIICTIFLQNLYLLLILFAYTDTYLFNKNIYKF